MLAQGTTWARAPSHCACLCKQQQGRAHPSVQQEQSRDVPTTGSPRGEATCTSDGQSYPGFLLTTHLQMACRSTQLHPDTGLTLAGGMVPFPARREDLNPPYSGGSKRLTAVQQQWWCWMSVGAQPSGVRQCPEQPHCCSGKK